MSGPAAVRTVSKPWGHETIWAHTDRYVGKILHIKAGHALSVQYHNAKDETVYLLSGEIMYWVQAQGERARGHAARRRASRSASRRAPSTTWKPSPTATCSRRRRRSSTTSCGSRTATDEREPAHHESDHSAGRQGHAPSPAHARHARSRCCKVAGKPVMDYVMEDARRSSATSSRSSTSPATSRRRSRSTRAQTFDDPVGVHRAEGAGRHRRRGGAGARRTSTSRCSSSSSTRSSTPICRSSNTHRCRRHHLGEGGRGLPALRRRRHRRRRQHDEDRREAERRRSRSARTSACTTSGTGSCCTRASTTCSRSRRTRASTT